MKLIGIDIGTTTVSVVMADAETGKFYADLDSPLWVEKYGCSGD